MLNPKISFVVSNVFFYVFLVSSWIYRMNIDSEGDFSSLTAVEQWEYINNLIIYLSVLFFAAPLISVYHIKVERFYKKYKSQ